ASMLFADLGPRIFFVSQGGYDTHDSQLGTHDDLLTELDQSLDAFYRDLVEHGQDQRVLVMTYSEFGRRVDDNASGGTDHGTAAPLFVFGTKERGGLYGEPPPLKALDADGHLKFSTDLRVVYASVLPNWIEPGPERILDNDDYPAIPFSRRSIVAAREREAPLRPPAPVPAPSPSPPDSPAPSILSRAARPPRSPSPAPGA